MRVGTYARISDDAEQLGLGVGRQQDDTRKLVDLRGWTLADTYLDNDVSAYQPKVIRPDFERMLADLETGVIQGAIVKTCGSRSFSQLPAGPSFRVARRACR